MEPQPPNTTEMAINTVPSPPPSPPSQGNTTLKKKERPPSPLSEWPLGRLSTTDVGSCNTGPAGSGSRSATHQRCSGYPSLCACGQACMGGALQWPWSQEARLSGFRPGWSALSWGLALQLPIVPCTVPSSAPHAHAAGQYPLPLPLPPVFRSNAPKCDKPFVVTLCVFPWPHGLNRAKVFFTELPSVPDGFWPVVVSEARALPSQGRVVVMKPNTASMIVLRTGPDLHSQIQSYSVVKVVPCGGALWEVLRGACAWTPRHATDCPAPWFMRERETCHARATCDKGGGGGAQGTPPQWPLLWVWVRVWDRE